MKVFSYFEPARDGSLLDELKIALLWAESWRKCEFEPVFLNERTGGLAEIEEGGLYSDTRVINYGWTLSQADHGRAGANKILQLMPNLSLGYGKQAAWLALKHFKPALVDLPYGKEYLADDWADAMLVWYSPASLKGIADPAAFIKGAR